MFWKKNRMLLIAILIAVIGAVLLGTVFACAVGQQEASAMPIERDTMLPIATDSVIAPKLTAEGKESPQTTAIPAHEGKVEDADTAYYIVRRAVGLLGGTEPPMDFEAEYYEASGEIPSHWFVRHKRLEDIEQAGAQRSVMQNFYAQVHAETGELMSYYGEDIVRAMLNGWGSATEEEGKALLEKAAEIEAEAKQRIQAFLPNETIRWAKLGFVLRQEGYLQAVVYVYTENGKTHTLQLLLNDGYYEFMVYNVADSEFDVVPATFIDNDADAWMWELETFDRIELVSPRNFEKGTPAEGQLTEEEIKARCAEFFSVATETELSGMLVKYYKDLSGKREDYYAVTMYWGENKVKLALSAGTGDLLAYEGELPVTPMLIGDNNKKVYDWVDETGFGEGKEFNHAYEWLEKTVKALCGDSMVKEISINAVHDDYYMTLDVEMRTGRFHEFGFRIQDGKAALEYVEVYYSGDAFYNGYMTPWEADIRVLVPSTGEIQKGWLGPEKLGAALLP